MPYLIVIGGPTGIGKTKVAMEIAKVLGCPIVSADSRQVYREMNIGTAKPTWKDRTEIEHHFIDNLSIHDEYSVGDFERDVLKALNELYKEHRVVIMVGGTGLYINAVLYGLDEFPNIKEGVREKYNALFLKDGIEPLQKMLFEKDPAYAKKVDIDNPHRLIRALSVIDSSGKKFSSFLTKQGRDRPFEAIQIALTMGREKLYESINKRADKMMEGGRLLAEAKNLYRQKNSLVRNTLGYAELFDYFDGNYSLPEAKEKIKQNTRRYAKRQMTWFRNQGEWEYFEAGDLQGMLGWISNHISG